MTTTDGGTTSGYSLIGSLKSAMAPAISDERRQDRGEDRPVDEEAREFHWRLRHVGQPSLARDPGARRAPMATRCGVTGTGPHPLQPLTTIMSPAFRPSRTTRRPSISGPSFTGVYSTLLSAPTASTYLTF